MKHLKTIHQEATAKAKASRQELVTHLEQIEHLPIFDKTWMLIGRALIDSKIEGITKGLEMTTEEIELAAYTRGYIAGLEDAK